MKICPTCNSSYFDETLNFCLTDGVPLVVEEVLAEKLAAAKGVWQTAETLPDGKLQVPDFEAAADHITSINPVAPPTAPDLKIKTVFSSPTPQPTIPGKIWRSLTVPILGTALMLGAIGGISAWLYMDKSATVNMAGKQTSADDKTAAIKKPFTIITADEENKIKKEVTNLITNWNASNEKKDIEAHISNYVDTLKIYYGESGIDKNHVRADRLRAYQRYDSIALQIDRLKIMPESTESATAVFNKSWTMKNDKKTSTGSVQQEMHLTKINGKWLIDAEKDLKVNFINNLENPDADPDTDSNKN